MPRIYAQDTDISPDGRTLYVLRGYVGDVAAFDIASRRMLWNRPLNTSRADHLTLTRDRAQPVRLGTLSDNRVYKIVTATAARSPGILVTGVYPHDNKVSRDGRIMALRSRTTARRSAWPAALRDYAASVRVPESHLDLATIPARPTVLAGCGNGGRRAASAALLTHAATISHSISILEAQRDSSTTNGQWPRSTSRSRDYRCP